jgi:hypothetical protein
VKKPVSSVRQEPKTDSVHFSGTHQALLFPDGEEIKAFVQTILNRTVTETVDHMEEAYDGLLEAEMSLDGDKLVVDFKGKVADPKRPYFDWCKIIFQVLQKDGLVGMAADVRDPGVENKKTGPKESVFDLIMSLLFQENVATANRVHLSERTGMRATYNYKP